MTPNLAQPETAPEGEGLDAWRNIPIDTHNCHLAITACSELADEIERLRAVLDGCLFDAEFIACNPPQHSDTVWGQACREVAKAIRNRRAALSRGLK